MFVSIEASTAVHPMQSRRFLETSPGLTAGPGAPAMGSGRSGQLLGSQANELADHLHFATYICTHTPKKKQKALDVHVHMQSLQLITCLFKDLLVSQLNTHGTAKAQAKGFGFRVKAIGNASSLRQTQQAFDINSHDG